MYQKLLTPPVEAPVTVAQLCSFGRFDMPPGGADYSLLELYIAAATDQVEIMAQTACMPEQVLLTLDFFPNTADPRNWLQYELSYTFAVTPWWWRGYPTKDSIELVRRPVQVPTSGASVAVSGVNLPGNNTVSVTCANTTGSPASLVINVGNVVTISGSAEGNVAQPVLTPSTTPFLNGVPLTVVSASPTGFVATFNNFYTTNSAGTVVPGSYVNNDDSGVATIMVNPLVVTYFDQNGILNTWNTIYYYVLYDKISLAVGQVWPLVDRRQDCIQISYWAGNATPAAAYGLSAGSVNPKLQMAILYLANHFWNVRDIIAVEPTSEIGMTLCKMLL